jgi:hypothetical protein
LTLQSLARSLAVASLVLAAIAAMRWRRTTPDDVASANGVVPSRTKTHVPPDMTDSVTEAADLTVDNDPFRLTNSPPSVRYDVATDGVAPATVAVRPPRPVLVLKAIVGGPPWQAVIDGIPGQPPGTIAEVGKRFDKFLVRAVTRDSVIVQGPDTSWVLSFRRGS